MFIFEKQIAGLIAAVAVFLAIAGCAAPENVILAQAREIEQKRSEINTIYNYITVTVDGISGRGTASLSIDYDKMVKDHPSWFSDSNKTLSGTDFQIAKSIAQSNIYGSLSKTGGLSNGDTITFSWSKTTENYFFNRYKNLSMIFYQQEYSLDNCFAEPSSEMRSVDNSNGNAASNKTDIFEGIYLEYEGASPYATAQLEGESVNVPNLYGYNFTLSKTQFLANGDVVTISPINSSFTDQCKAQGITPESTQKRIVIDDIPYYITTLRDVPQEQMEEFVVSGQAILSEYYSSYAYSKSISIDSIEYVGSYLLSVVKDEARTYVPSTINKLYLLYRIDAIDLKNGSETITFYQYIEAKNVVRDGNALLSEDTASGEIKLSKGFSLYDNYSGEYGFISINEFVENVVSSGKGLNPVLSTKFVWESSITW